MSVFDPSSLESTSNVSPTTPCRMAPIRFMSGPGHAMPRASIVLSICTVLISNSSHEKDLAVAGRGHECGDALDAVHDRVEVGPRQVEHVHRQRAGLDVDVADLLRLLE